MVKNIDEFINDYVSKICGYKKIRVRMNFVNQLTIGGEVITNKSKTNIENILTNEIMVTFGYLPKDILNYWVNKLSV